MKWGKGRNGQSITSHLSVLMADGWMPCEKLLHSPGATASVDSDLKPWARTHTSWSFLCRVFCQSGEESSKHRREAWTEVLFPSLFFLCCWAIGFQGAHIDDKRLRWLSIICSRIKINKRISGPKRLLEGASQSPHVLFVATSDVYFGKKSSTIW